MSTFYVDLENGNDANDGTSFANRWLTLTSGATAARIAPGDTIRIMGSPAPTALGQNVTWTNKSATLTLTTAVTKTISTCDSVWTAVAGVTVSADTLCRQGTNSAYAYRFSGVTTGKQIYKALGASTDFSAYKQVMFWWNSSYAHASGVFTLRLCSDTTGDITVNTITIPAVQSGCTSHWIPVVVDTAAALGAAIQSIAIYAESAPSAFMFHIDNIEAGKDAAAADAVTLNSLLSKNANDGYGGTLWWPIRSIVDTTVILETAYCDAPTTVGNGYYGTTATVATYKRETIKLTSTSGVLNISDGGGPGNHIVYSGGWNRTDMSTQDGVTFVDNRSVPQGGSAMNGFNGGISQRTDLSKVRVVGGDVGFAFGNSGYNQLDDIQAIIPAGYGIVLPSYLVTFPEAESQLTNAYVIGGLNIAVVHDATLNTQLCGWNFSVWVYDNRGTSALLLNLDTCLGEFHFYNNSQSPAIGLKSSEISSIELRDTYPLILLNCLDSSIDTLTVADTGLSLGVQLTGGNTVGIPSNVCQSNLVINQLTASLTSGVMTVFSGGYQTAADIFVRASTLTGGTISPGSPGVPSSRISWANYNGTAGDHRLYTGLVTITADTTTRHTASGNSWKVTATQNYGTAAYPVKLPLGNIYCVASQAVTISVWLYRTNTGCGAALAIPKGRIPGKVADARTAMTAAINTWEQVSITFTPTADCIVPVRLEFGPVANGQSVYFDDLSVSQSGTAPDFKTLDFAGLSGRPFLGPAAQSFAASSGAGGGLLSQRGFTGGLPG